MIEELNNAVEEMEEEGYTSCEACGEQIFDESDDFNGMCTYCYNTPPDNLN